ncbi:MAG TPA: DUF308 domain-containing protein [Candidatus Binatia bacterium]|nr:DUF308 domain-containing protein [Candidatus Binatia bacterium]
MAEFRDAVAAVGQRLTDRIGRFWWILLTRGIVAVLFGIAALFWPQKSLTLLVFLVGGYLVVDGLSGLLLAVRSGDFGASLLQGLVSTVAGVAVLLWPGITTNLLLALLGAWALVQGVGMWLAGRNLRADGEDGNLLLTVGALLAVFGIAAIVWRGVGAVAVSWIIALVALVVGGLMIFIARRLKSVQERLQSVGRGGV